MWSNRSQKTTRNRGGGGETGWGRWARCGWAKRGATSPVISRLPSLSLREPADLYFPPPLASQNTPGSHEGHACVSERQNLAPRNVASLKFLDVSCHNNLFPFLCFCECKPPPPPCAPPAGAPPEGHFYLRSQPSDDSALTDGLQIMHTHMSSGCRIPTYPPPPPPRGEPQFPWFSLSPQISRIWLGSSLTCSVTFPL